MARILRMARMDGEFEQKGAKGAEGGQREEGTRPSMTRQMGDPGEPRGPSASKCRADSLERELLKVDCPSPPTL